MYLQKVGNKVIPSGGQKLRYGNALEGTEPSDLVTKSQLDEVTAGEIELTQVELGDGTAADPALTFADDPNTGLYRSASGTVNYSSEGVSQVEFADGTILPTTDNDIALGSASKKFISLSLVDGTVGALSLRLGADGNNGIYGVSDTQLGFAVEGTLVGGANTTGLFTDVISEQTSTVGVTVDGALIKDGGISANSMFAGFYPTAAGQSLSGPGAIGVTQYYTAWTTTGADAGTMAAGTQIGQRKKIKLIVDGGDGTLTPTSLSGGTTITFNDAGDYVEMLWNGTNWFVIENFGCTIA